MTTPLPGAMDLLKAAKEHIMKRGKFFMGIVVIPSVVYLVATVLFTMPPLGPIIGSVLMLVGLVLYAFATVALVLGVDQESMTDWRAAYSASRGKVLPMIWTGILVTIVVLIGTLLLILPGIYLSILFGFYTFTSVLEGKRGWDAATRSKELVKGRWWEVFGRWVVIGLVVGVVYLIIAGIAGLINETYLLPLVDFLLNLVFTPIFVAISYLMYKHLKANPMMPPQAPAAPVQGQPMA